MRQNEDSGMGVDFETAHGRDWPSIRQFNVFVANRVGGMLDVVRRLEQSRNPIISLTVVDTSDCAILRIVPTDPERATEAFHQAKLPYTESDLVVVQLPEGTHPVSEICQVVLPTEMNIHYAYSIFIGPIGRSAIALHVEDPEMAAGALASAGFTLVTEKDLSSDS